MVVYEPRSLADQVDVLTAMPDVTRQHAPENEIGGARGRSGGLTGPSQIQKRRVRSSPDGSLTFADLTFVDLTGIIYTGETTWPEESTTPPARDHP